MKWKVGMEDYKMEDERQRPATPCGIEKSCHKWLTLENYSIFSIAKWSTEGLV